MGVLPQPPAKKPMVTQPDLDAVEDELEPENTSPQSPEQTGESDVPARAPSSTLMLDEESDLADDLERMVDDDDEKTPPPRAPPPPRRPPSKTTPAVKPATGTNKAHTGTNRAVAKAETASGAVKPRPLRRVALASDGFEPTGLSQEDVPAVIDPKPLRPPWSVTINGNTVSAVELALTLLAIVIFAGLIWLFI